MLEARPRQSRMSATRTRLTRPVRAVAISAGVSLVAALGVVSLTSPASAANSLLSQGKTATASSVENVDYTPASWAFDGNLSTTRWASLPSDNQWLEVDLGKAATLGQILLRWEAAYASSYKIELSSDNVSWTSIYSTTSGPGGNETLNVTGTGRYVRLTGIKRATGYGYSLWEMQVLGTFVAPATTPPPPPPFTPNLDPGESITVGGYPTTYSTYVPPAGQPTHHEFQANCSYANNHPDDPIVFPKQPGASHDHTFIGNASVTAASTTGSLTAGAANCTVPKDKSGYWFPTLYNGTTVVAPSGPQVVYYKTGVADYRSVVPFPKGLRFVVGTPSATALTFQQSPGTVIGWECGNSVNNWDFPATCAPGSQLVVRYQAPSCWDGVHLDVADHKSHMMYPVDGHCTSDHPVAVPMLEFKMAFPVSGDMSQVHLASGRGYSWHYDFFNAWDPATLNALVKHCIVGGLQCDTRGYDQYKAYAGYALDANYNPIVF